MEYKDLTLRSLIGKCVGKDALAWAEFVRRFFSLISFSVKRALFKYSSGTNALEEEIKDISQEILATLWGKNELAKVQNKENINFWLVIIARNSVINHLKSRRKEVLVADDAYFEKLPAKYSGPESCEAENAGFREKIDELYGALNAREKIIFKLYFKKKLRLKDISRIMNIPLGTVSSIITRMRKNFKK